MSGPTQQQPTRPSAVRPARRWTWLLLVLAWLNPLRAAELAADEFQVAFISKMLPYVGWPRESFGSADSPVIVGLAGSDPFGGLLQKVLSDARVEERPIEVRVLPNAAAATNCHALFLGSDQLARWDDWKTATASRAVLTIAADESGAFLDRGGVFNLRVGEHKLEINRANADRARLRISSKLLRIAKVK